ncbi:MAG TPA: hypothetical protein PLD95_03915 [bacterium]|nr:hypothetical protein [bacterium]HOG38588.1 hypothetical protein [bacterium]
MKNIFIVFTLSLITLAVMMITSGCYIRAGFYDQGLIDSTGKSVFNGPIDVVFPNTGDTPIFMNLTGGGFSVNRMICPGEAIPHMLGAGKYKLSIEKDGEVYTGEVILWDKGDFIIFGKKVDDFIYLDKKWEEWRNAPPKRYRL